MEKSSESFSSMIKSVFNTASSMSTFGVKLKHNSAHIQKYVKNLRDVITVLEKAFDTVVDTQGSIVAGSENIASLLDDTSANIQKVYKSATATSTSTASTGKQMEQVKTQNKNVYDQITELDNTVRDIFGAIKSINDISVKSRMLSINASIEAARAGNTGRGFAVVAQEMQTLSQNTSTFVTHIEQLLESVNKSLDMTKDSIDNSSHSIDIMADMLRELTKGIQHTETNLNEISSNINSISSITETFSLNTQSTTQTINDCKQSISDVYKVTTDIEGVHKSLNTLEDEFGTVERSAADNAKMMGSMSDYPGFKLSNDDFISILKTATVAHENWVKTVKDMMDRMTILPLQTNSHRCGFGHYYYVLKPQNRKVVDIWRSIEPVHDALHACGDDIARAIEKNDQRGAKAYVDKATNYSKEIIAKLEKLINITQEVQAEGLNVFDA